MELSLPLLLIENESPAKIISEKINWPVLSQTEMNDNWNRKFPATLTTRLTKILKIHLTEIIVRFPSQPKI